MTAQDALTWGLGILALLGSGGLGGILWRLQKRFSDIETRVKVIEETCVDHKGLQPMLNHVIATIGSKVEKMERELRDGADRMADKVNAIAMSVAALAAREGTIDYSAINQRTVDRHSRGS